MTNEPERAKESPSDSAGPDQASKRFKFALSDGVFVAVASASMYLWAFQYENGFASFFGIPPQLIVVGLGNVLLIAALLTGFVLSIFSIVSGLVSLLFPTLSRHPLIRHHAITMAMFLPILFAPAYLYWTKLWWTGAFLGAVALGATLFGRPLLRKEEGYINKLEAQAKLDQRDRVVTLIGIATSRLGPTLPWVILFLILSFLVSYMAGDAAATNQKEFLVISSGSQEMALLRVYGDNLVLAPFDRKTKEVQKSFIIVRVQDLKTPLTVEEVGPLNPIKSQTVPPLPVPSPSPQAGATRVPTVMPKT